MAVQSLDALYIILYVIAATLVLEALTWQFVYRTASFKNLKDSYVRTAKRLESLKNKQHKKKKEEKLQKLLVDGSATKDINYVRMWQGGLTILVMGISYRLLSRRYDGVVVGRLPFEPLKFFQGITHRGLKGDDFTEFSWLFVYVTAQGSIRAILVKILDFGLPRNLVNNAYNQFSQKYGLDKMS